MKANKLSRHLARLIQIKRPLRTTNKLALNTVYQSAQMRVLQFSIAYFLIGILAGSILGFFRVVLIEPAVGKLFAVALEIPIILSITWTGCGFILNIFGKFFSAAEGFAVGLIAFALLLSAEIALSCLIFSKPVHQQIVELLNPSALLGLSAQVVYGAFPLIRRNNA